MLLIDHTFDDPAANLALDEALLQATTPIETLRLWRPVRPVVVVGRSSRIASEVDLDACQRADVPVLRRVSGGATIVTGPGCLMYAVVLDSQRTPSAADVSAAHRYVLGRMLRALGPLRPSLVIAGTSDLALQPAGAPAEAFRKVSGNAVRRVRSRLLYHGTLLNHFDLELVTRLLRTPPRQPDYRAARRHADFLANLELDEAQLATAIIAEWQATPASDTAYPASLEDALHVAQKKHQDRTWTFSR
ncbi:lipoate--protein ligase family protein [Botrimarina hoheduenensis]|uniref:Lipoate-protein ligase LplJ n=1 Tax=Botrimarina hoheduenensis TaxID=2528000 RepID=A0A5C5W8D1_9BACT|nr:lipoate--protein ligase family protein [Botrimarina hoheduenensis]TWT46513.1 Lipoate-protein ligase LplJ [Botrimarina hoheduenensis]